MDTILELTIYTILNNFIHINHKVIFLLVHITIILKMNLKICHII